MAETAPPPASAPETIVPGVKAKHVWITDTCRANRGDTAALSVAGDALLSELFECLQGNPPGSGTVFHLVLTVERPGTGGRGD